MAESILSNEEFLSLSEAEQDRYLELIGASEPMGPPHNLMATTTRPVLGGGNTLRELNQDPGFYSKYLTGVGKSTVGMAGRATGYVEGGINYLQGEGFHPEPQTADLTSLSETQGGAEGFGSFVGNAAASLGTLPAVAGASIPTAMLRGLISSGLMAKLQGASNTGAGVAAGLGAAAPVASSVAGLVKNRQARLAGENAVRALSPSGYREEEIALKAAPLLLERNISPDPRKSAELVGRLRREAGTKLEEVTAPIQDVPSDLTPSMGTLRALRDRFINIGKSGARLRSTDARLADRTTKEMRESIEDVASRTGSLPAVPYRDIKDLQRKIGTEIDFNSPETPTPKVVQEVKKGMYAVFRKILHDDHPAAEAADEAFTIAATMDDALTNAARNQAIPGGRAGWIPTGLRGVAYKTVLSAISSPQWAATSAMTRNKIARALADGNVETVMSLLRGAGIAVSSGVTEDRP